MNRHLPFVMLVLLFTIVTCGPSSTPTAPLPSPTQAPPGPAIQSFFPADAAPPGAVINLQGQHFGDEPGAVTFGGTPATVRNWDNTSIDVRVPLDAATGKVQVAVSAGGQPSEEVPFTVLTPSLASVGLRGGFFYGGVVADFDSDGDPDMFVPGSVPEFGVDSAYYFNNGDGTFAEQDLAEVGLPVGMASEDAVAEDFDRDGDMDLYIVGSSPGAYALNNGDGTFTQQNLAEAGLEMRPDQVPVQKLAVVAADFDRDGDRDMFVPGSVPEFGVDSAYYLNNGDGTFTERNLTEVGLPVGMASEDAVAEDFDRDGDVDLYIVGSSPGAYALNNGDGTFAQQNLAESGLEMRPDQVPVQKLAVVADDFDQDGDLDLFVDMGFSEPTDDFYALNDGDGTFTPLDLAGSGIPAGGDGKYGSAADLNGDGAPDLFVGHLDAEASYLLNDGDGTFTLQDLAAAGLAEVGAGSHSVPADFDLDGDLDLFLADVEPADNFSVEEFYALNNADGTFVLQDLAVVGLSTPPHQFHYFVAADLNGDGAVDLYGANVWEPGGIYALNNGDGTFSLQDLAAVGLAVDVPTGIPAAADFDGDGDLDLFLGTAYALNKGDGTFVLFH